MQGSLFTDDFTEEKTVVVPKPYCPRPYQTQADEAAWNFLQHADMCGLYLATGTGKTEIGALLCRRVMADGALYITPRRELVVQTAERLTLRGVDCDIEMAERRSDKRITVACYASLQSRKRFERFLGQKKLVIVDESHMNYSESALKMLEQFRSWGAKVIGMTASPPHKKNVVLTEHFGEAAFVYDYQQASADAYLTQCKTHLCVIEDLDLTGFKATFGGSDPDFNPTRVARLMEKKAVVAGIGSMVAQYWEVMPAVVFCACIDQAELVRDDLWGRGIQASIVHSKMDEDEQRLHLNDFMAGKSDLIINVGILTVGWDAPHVRKLFIARPTASTNLYLQMFGRGTRCFPPGVIDGIDTVDGRLDAISRSPKPFFEVFDITDASRHNDIKTALNILRPSIDDRLMLRVRRRNQRAPIAPEELDPINIEEKKALAAEQAAIDALEMRKRGNVHVGGQIVAYERDTFADAETSHRKKIIDFWWMPYGRFKGRGFAKIHAEAPWYLPSVLPHVKDQNLARNIRKFLSAR